MLELAVQVKAAEAGRKCAPGGEICESCAPGGKICALGGEFLGVSACASHIAHNLQVHEEQYQDLFWVSVLKQGNRP